MVSQPYKNLPRSSPTPHCTRSLRSIKHFLSETMLIGYYAEEDMGHLDLKAQGKKVALHVLQALAATVGTRNR